MTPPNGTKLIPGFIGYAITSSGELWSCRDLGGMGITAEWHKMKPQMAKGYVRAQIMRAGKQERLLCHRLVWEAWMGPIPTGMQINHRNGIKTDNRLENLEVVTPQENTAHAMRHGLRIAHRGERAAASKLSESDARRVFKLRQERKTQAEIAATIGTTRSNVSAILRGTSWGNLGLNNPMPGPRCTECQAREVFQRNHAGQKNKDIASEMGIARPTVSNILRGRAWAHLGLKRREP